MLRTLKYFLSQVYTIISIVLFMFSYGAIKASAIYYPTDNITNPTCAPGDSGCYVSLLPDQTSKSGSLLFSNGTNPNWSNPSGLNWDSVNGRLGVGTATPTQALDVSGKIALDGAVIAYRPTTMTGTLIFGDGGNNLSHTSGAEGYYNTFVGISSGLVNTTGNQNTAIGMQSLFSNTTGTYNTASGLNSLSSNTTGSRNTATGMQSLFSNTTGTYNTANGMSSLFGNTTGTYNTAYGYLSGRYVADGESNQTSNNSLYLGYDTRALVDGGTNEIVIGSNAVGIGSNTVTLGNSSIITTALKGNIGIGTTTPAFQFHMVGTAPNMTVQRYSDSTTPPVFRGWKSRGTTSVPSAVLSGDSLAFFIGGGYDGSGSFDTASIKMVAAENFTGSSNRGTYISFNTNAIGTAASSGGFERMRISDSGNVGIGITSPLSNLHIYTSSSNTPQGIVLDQGGGNSGRLFFMTNGGPAYNIYYNGVADSLYFAAGGTPGVTSGSTMMTLSSNGRLTVNNGSTVGSYSLNVGSSSVTGIVSRFQNSTGTCDINPTTTSLSCSSDRTLKTNITNLNNTILNQITTLQPVTYTWINDTTNQQQTGFIAQDVEAIFPNLVSTDPNTNLKSLNYIGLIPYTIEGIKELDIKLNQLSSLDTTLQGSFGYLAKEFLGDINNKIDTIFAKKIKTEELCIKDTCVTEDQLKALLNNAQINQTPQVQTEPEPQALDPVIPPADTAPDNTQNEISVE